jgi:hypothetical protein
MAAKVIGLDLSHGDDVSVIVVMERRGYSFQVLATIETTASTYEDDLILAKMKYNVDDSHVHIYRENYRNGKEYLYHRG